jgi:hypothetical protein
MDRSKHQEHDTALAASYRPMTALIDLVAINRVLQPFLQYSVTHIIAITIPSSTRSLIKV